MLEIITNIMNTNSTCPSKIQFGLLGDFCSDANTEIEICNNGYDSVPDWESVPYYSEEAISYKFKNKNKTASNYGIKIKIKIDGNNSYLSGVWGRWR